MKNIRRSRNGILTYESGEPVPGYHNHRARRRLARRRLDGSTATERSDGESSASSLEWTGLGSGLGVVRGKATDVVEEIAGGESAVNIINPVNLKSIYRGKNNQILEAKISIEKEDMTKAYFVCQEKKIVGDKTRKIDINHIHKIEGRLKKDKYELMFRYWKPKNNEQSVAKEKVTFKDCTDECLTIRASPQDCDLLIANMIRVLDSRGALVPTPYVFSGEFQDPIVVKYPEYLKTEDQKKAYYIQEYTEVTDMAPEDMVHGTRKFRTWKHLYHAAFTLSPDEEAEEFDLNMIPDREKFFIYKLAVARRNIEDQVKGIKRQMVEEYVEKAGIKDHSKIRDNYYERWGITNFMVTEAKGTLSTELADAKLEYFKNLGLIISEKELSKLTNEAHDLIEQAYYNKLDEEIWQSVSIGLCEYKPIEKAGKEDTAYINSKLAEKRKRFEPKELKKAQEAAQNEMDRLFQCSVALEKKADEEGKKVYYATLKIENWEDLNTEQLAEAMTKTTKAERKTAAENQQKAYMTYSDEHKVKCYKKK